VISPAVTSVKRLLSPHPETNPASWRICPSKPRHHSRRAGFGHLDQMGLKFIRLQFLGAFREIFGEGNWAATMQEQVWPV